MKTKKVPGPTPSRADYSEIVFLDAKHNVVDEKEATMAIIRECMKDGAVINETIGFCGDK